MGATQPMARVRLARAGSAGVATIWACRIVVAICLVLGCALMLSPSGCKRRAKNAASDKQRHPRLLEAKSETAATQAAPDQPDAERKPTPQRPAPRRKSVREVYAAWYEVPAESLAKRRAGLDELTAAHNHLPIGTLVRITHLKNGKSVLVRITDRGIRDSKAKIDLCKEAADELGMVSEGMAKVRMEVVDDDQKPALSGSAAVSAAAAPRP